MHMYYSAQEMGAGRRTQPLLGQELNMVQTSLLLMSISSLQCGYLFSVECVYMCVCVVGLLLNHPPPYFSETGSLDLDLINSA